MENHRMNTYWKKTACPYDCPTTCGFYVETDGKQIFSVRPDKEDPSSGGLICGKMRHYEKDIHDPNRILTPMKRTGAKGEGRFAPISWEEAVTEITDRWKALISRYGAESIAYSNYSGVMSQIQRHCGTAFFRRLGVREVVMTLCSAAKGEGYRSVLGSTGCLDPRELKDSDYYLIWGCQMGATRLQEIPDITKGRRQGKKAVVIEVFAGNMAPHCDELVLIRPGTDGALALAMMQVLKEEQLMDLDFMQSQSVGFEEFYNSLNAYTPEWASRETGIPEDTIRRLALEYGHAKAPAIILGSGNSRYENGGMTVRLIVLLSLMTGAWKRPGGGFVGASPAASPYLDPNRIKRPDWIHSTGKININQMGAALSADAPDLIRSLYVYGNNLADTVSDQAGIRRGLEREDLFTVVHERFVTDTARYADILLPAAFSVEQSDIFTPYGYCAFGTSWKIMDPPGKALSNWNTFRLLARGMGFEEEYFQKTEEEMLEDLLEHLPCRQELSDSQIRTLKEGGMISMPFADHTCWKTPSRKIQVVSPDLPDPLPAYQPPAKDLYPLRLVSVPAMATLNTTFIERQALANRRGSMKLMMHPLDAASRGISSGDRVIAFNDLAEVEFEASVTCDIVQGAVAAPGVYRASQTFNGLGVNALQHGRISRLGEATTMNDNSVEVRRKP